MHGDYVSRLQKLTIIKREAWDEEGGAPSSYEAWDEGSSARLVLARGRTCESRRCRRSDPPTEEEPKSGLQARGRGGGQKREALLAGAEGGVYQPPETPTQPQSHKRRVVQLHGDYVSRLQKLTIIKREAWDEEGGAPSSHEAWDEGSGARLVLARGCTIEPRECRRSGPSTEAEPKSGL